MVKDTFPLAVHYYRQPTPLPEEWERDLEHMRELGINTIQLRPQWRWHERVEGTYAWDDIDRLFDLAEKHDLDVVFKFMLETAPDWLYRDYPAMRITPEGVPLVPRTIGAFYVGGWMPCFDVPEVRERAARFVRAAVERYRDRPSLAWWHAWNEPRSRPMGECACPASTVSYRKYLERRFGTVEELNAFAGKCWASFDDVKAPVDPGEYTEMSLWRHWAAESVVERVRMVVEAIRSVDTDHPVMSHVGCCSPIQNALEDTSDDVLVAPEVDLYGSSLAAELDGGMTPDGSALNCDWIRAAGRGRKWWINEAYVDPCIGFRLESGPAHVRHTVLTPIAHGAAGVMLWQYRAERYAMESNDNGIVTSAGEDTPRSEEVARLGKFLEKHGGLFTDSRVPQGRIALVYDFRSDLVSAMEGACFDKPVQPDHPYSVRVPYAYKRALQGAYSMFFRAGHQVEWVDSRGAERLCDGFDLAYMPLPFIAGENLAGHLLRFVQEGGMLVAEAGLGLRVENAWINPDPPGPPELGYRLKRHFRLVGKRAEAQMNLAGEATFAAEECFDILEAVEGGNARPVGAWTGDLPREIPSDSPAAVECPVGKGRVLALAFSPGLTNYWTKDGSFAAALAAEAGVEPLVKLEGEGMENVVARMLTASDGRRVLFLRNAGGTEARIEMSCLQGLEEDIWGGTRTESDHLVIPPGEFGVLLEK